MPPPSDSPLHRICHLATSLFDCQSAALLQAPPSNWYMVAAEPSFPDLSPTVVQALDDALNAPEGSTSEYFLHRITDSAAPTPHLFVALSTPLDSDSATLDHFITTVRDLLNAQEAQEMANQAEALVDAERQEREALIDELRRSNERLEQFAYIASHDLQEPLRMVTGFMDLLQDEYAPDLDDDANEYIEYAVDGARRMKEMISGLLTYSRTWSSDEAITTVRTSELVDQLARDVVKGHDEPAPTISVADLPDLQARPSQLRRLFSNLLINAITHAGPAPRITITHEQKYDHHLFGVADDGPGIAPDQQERIFDLFVSGIQRQSNQSSGLGLAICRSIIEGHGGRLWVESIPGDGACFYFTIPRD